MNSRIGYRLVVLLAAVAWPALSTVSGAERKPNILFNLATDLKYREVLLQHRELLTRFGKEHNDTVVKQLLADNVKPIGFTAENAMPKTKSAKKAKKQDLYRVK